MARNVEIKAKLSNSGRQRELAEILSGSSGEIINQEDVFFNCAVGRLKLRVLSSDDGHLICYDRPDQAGPKTSTYSIYTTTDPATLRNVLEQSLGVPAIVRKVRLLFMVGRTRIHIDTVDDLGDFLEIEVVLNENEDIEIGQREASELMRELEIESSSLIEKAYVDLLLDTTTESDHPTVGGANPSR